MGWGEKVRQRASCPRCAGRRGKTHVCLARTGASRGISRRQFVRPANRSAACFVRRGRQATTPDERRSRWSIDARRDAGPTRVETWWRLVETDGQTRTPEADAAVSAEASAVAAARTDRRTGAARALMPVRATRAFAGATAGAAAEMAKADMLTRGVALLLEEVRRPTRESARGRVGPGGDRARPHRIRRMSISVSYLRTEKKTRTRCDWPRPLRDADRGRCPITQKIGGFAPEWLSTCP